MTDKHAGEAMVPRVPTIEMVRAGYEANPTGINVTVGKIYAAMLDAAPPQAGNSRDEVIEECARIADEANCETRLDDPDVAAECVAKSIASAIRALARGRGDAQ